MEPLQIGHTWAPGACPALDMSRHWTQKRKCMHGSTMESLWFSPHMEHMVTSSLARKLSTSRSSSRMR
eukprot:CAMPEP_0185560714 /NCGR_PEP_ID=MMETSP1381-20130426/57529_1 /TAXON_ID=298111 /ORGANISM="Pavlova sp., Strain CCMP459" /LENGTH=67 /DNA_ID=CAMNT_0028174447 /DNA_START=223 /DNA_END=423 /DNA_ORIENTATION=+